MQNWGDMPADFVATLHDTLARILFEPDYLLQSVPGDYTHLYPLFSVERARCPLPFDGHAREAVHKAAAFLRHFQRHTSMRLMQTALGVEVAADTDPGLDVTVFVGDRDFNLGTEAGRRQFTGLAPIAPSSPHGVVRRPAPEVLVLGSYHPSPWLHVVDLLDRPVTPTERLAEHGRLTALERTLFVADRLRAGGLTAVTAMGDRTRHIPNVYLRIRELMRQTDHIVLLLNPGGMGVAIEYGVVLADPALAEKTVVFARRDEFISSVTDRGTFLLSTPVTVVYDHDAELQGLLDEHVFARLAAMAGQPSPPVESGLARHG